MNLNTPLKYVRIYNKDEWISYRNKHSTVSWDTILASGFDAVNCECGKEGCLGWKLDRVAPCAPTSPDWPRAA